MIDNQLPSSAQGNAYIAKLPESHKTMVSSLRALVRSVLPDAEERFSYQVLCYKTEYMIVGIGITKKYCSFYTMSPGLVKDLKPELKDIKQAGATLHFSPDEELPISLITKIIGLRLKENEAKAALKSKKNLKKNTP